MSSWGRDRSFRSKRDMQTTRVKYQMRIWPMSMRTLFRHHTGPQCLKEWKTFSRNPSGHNLMGLISHSFSLISGIPVSVPQFVSQCSSLRLGHFWSSPVLCSRISNNTQLQKDLQVSDRYLYTSSLRTSWLRCKETFIRPWLLALINVTA